MRKEYVLIAVDAGGIGDRLFTYRLPESLRDKAQIGSLLRVPFGRGGKSVKGYAVSFSETTDVPQDKLRDAEDILVGEDPERERLAHLAVWMSHHYSCPLIRALRTVMPEKRRMKERIDHTVTLAVPVPDAAARMREYEEKGQAAKARILSELISEQEMPQGLLLKKANAAKPSLISLNKDGLVEISSEAVRRFAYDAEIETREKSELTPPQKAALEKIRGEWENAGRPVLLHGLTGSGKTLLYMDLIEEILTQGRQAIVLIPEIALTYQTVRRFTARFGNAVSFLHSRLSEGERSDLFRAAEKKEVRVVIGPRSALFTPFPDLGLIIVDEEHEDTYRSESTPRYDARETAVKRAEIEGAKVLFGSATPSVKSYALAEKGEYLLVPLLTRFGSAVRRVQTADLREELKQGNRSVLSGPLKQELARVLSEGHQAMLFLNRRGYAGFVTCRSCGHVVKCPHCDVSLTEHGNGTLVCHYCGYSAARTGVCPECGSIAIGGMRIGTEQVERQIGEAFPGARILRMDRDTTGGKEGHTKILRQFAAHEADILIGTQMIVKGHDFPQVALIGVLAADLSLNDADYRSAERTFSLIAQAIGRCGRADVPGCAVIQTYRPDHYAVLAAAEEDYKAFYREEIAYRTLLEYPPCGEMLAVFGNAPDEAQLLNAMEYLRRYIGRIDPLDTLHALGPAYLSVKKVRDRYRAAIWLRSRDPEKLRAAAESMEKYIKLNKGFEGIQIQYDYNV